MNDKINVKSVARERNYKILPLNSDGLHPSVQINIRYIMYQNLDVTELIGQVPGAGCSEHGIETSGTIKPGEFLHNRETISFSIRTLLHEEN